MTDTETAKNGDFFKSDDIETKGHEIGYISIKDIDKTTMPKNAVIGCKNYDFYKGYDKPRSPYDLVKDLSAVLPSNYKIIRFAEKQFVDADGSKKSLLIVAAKNPNDSTSKLKLYVNSYYSPGYIEDDITRPYDNNYKPGLTNQRGWTDETIDGWYELTERYFDGEDPLGGSSPVQFQEENKVIGSITYTLKILNRADLFDKPQNFYKGWYLIGKDSNQTTCVIGIITDSYVEKTSGNFTALHFAVKKEINSNVTTANARGICRFPVNQLNNEIWCLIEDVQFNTDFPNTIRIYGKKITTDGISETGVSRPLWLGFITKRKYFGGLEFSTVIYDPPGTAGWCTPMGFYTGTDNTTFMIRCAGLRVATVPYRIQFKWSIDGGVNWTFLPEIVFYPFPPTNNLFDVIQDVTLGLQIRFYGYTNYMHLNDTATFSVSKGLTASWNGMWMRYDPPEVLNKKKYVYTDYTKPNGVILNKTEISNELGITYRYERDYLTTGDKKDRLYSLAIEIDGYQTLFIKQFFLGKPDVNNDFLKIYCYVLPWFDRSITAHRLYYVEDDTIDVIRQDSSDYELPDSFLFNDIKRGFYEVEKMAAVKEASSDSLIVKLIDTKDVDIYKWAKGELLSVDRLNGPYYKNIIQKPSHVIRVGDNIIAIGLSNDYINIDKDNSQRALSNGQELICISQLQQASNTESILTTGRIEPIARGFNLLGGAWMTENQFLIFTEKEILWLDLVDEKTKTIRTVAIFDTLGLIHPDALVTAREIPQSQAGPLTAPLSSKFKGTYLASQKSIYGFYDNKPVNLCAVEDEAGNVVFDRWMEEYQRLQNKTGIRAGFRLNSLDVYFWIPELNEIRIWNIPGQHWKKYYFPDQENIKYFLQAQDGELYFYTDTKIYKTESIGTLKKDDTVSETAVPIDFYLKKIVNHGNSQVMKVLDGFEITYDADDTTEDITLNIKVGTLDNSGDVFNEDIDLKKNKFYWKQQYSGRKRAQWYTFEITSNSTISNLTGFRLLMTKLKAFFTAGVSTRE